MQRFTKILLATDGSKGATAAEESALYLAKKHDAELIVADTMRNPGAIESWFVKNSDELFDALEHEKQAKLTEIEESFRSRGIKNVSTRLLHGRTSEQLTRLVIEEDCDLVIRARKGTYSRQNGIFGMTAMNLLRVCPCPVLLVKEDHPINAPKVLACVDVYDEEEANRPIMESANRLAEQEGQSGILYCWNLLGHEMIRRRMAPDRFERFRDDIRAEREERFEAFLESYGRQISEENVSAVFGDPEKVISEFSARHEIDVTVMATIAPNSPLSRLLGSTIESVLSHLDSNLLAVKPEGFVSPVEADMDLGDRSGEQIVGLPYVM